MSKKVEKEKGLDIYKLVKNLLKEIDPQVLRVVPAGSIARKEAGANDIDLVIIPKKDKKGNIQEIKLKDSAKVNWAGNYRIQHELKNGIHVDFLFTTPESWGASLLHFIGPKGHDIGLKMIAKRRGWKLNQYGLFNENGTCIACKTEEEILNALGKEWKSPELR